MRRCTWRGPRSKVPGYAACHVTGSDEVRPCTRRCSRSRCCSSPACSSPVLSSSSSPRCPRESNRVNACRWWATTVLFNPPPPTIVSTNPRETSSPFQRRFRAPSLFVPFPFSPLFELGCRELFSSSKVAVFFFFFFLFLFSANFANVTRVFCIYCKGEGRKGSWLRNTGFSLFIHGSCYARLVGCCLNENCAFGASYHMDGRNGSVSRSKGREIGVYLSVQSPLSKRRKIRFRQKFLNVIFRRPV